MNFTGHVIRKRAPQGDVLFVRLPNRAKIPASYVKRDTGPRIVVAHSETGHHHAIDDTGVVKYSDPADPWTCYLEISGEYADVIHHRAWDTHATFRLLKGVWKVRRQREHTPDGLRRVED